MPTGPEKQQSALARGLKKAADLADAASDRFGKPTDRQIVERLRQRGINTVISVPCSITQTMAAEWADLSRNDQMCLINTVNEHNTVGIASGFWFGTGEVPMVLVQNSGVPNLADGIISYANVYKLPMLVMVTWRGSNLTDDSEPHQEIGNITDDLTKIIAGRENNFGMKDGRGFMRRMDDAITRAQAGGRSLIRLSPDAFRKTYPMRLPEIEEENEEIIVERRARIKEAKGSDMAGVFRRQRISRAEAMQEIVHQHPNAAIVFANGFNSREAQGRLGVDREGNFYNAGYMGGTSAIAWGIAKSNRNIEVVGVEGDQNFMMGKMHEHLGAGDYPDNLSLYILDNRIGASVGTSASLKLPWWYYDIARVVRTIPDEPGSFALPRVKEQGKYFDKEAAKRLAKDIGPLPALTLMFRDWIIRQTEDNIKGRIIDDVREVIRVNSAGLS